MSAMLGAVSPVIVFARTLLPEPEIGVSPLLIVGLVLLVLAVGLTLIQRRSQRHDTVQPPRRAPAPGQAPPARAPVSPGAPTAPPRRMLDPVLGALTFNGADGWTGDEPLSLGGHAVSLLALAGPDGPSDAHREWVRLTIDRFETIEVDVLALLAHVLQPLGMGRSDVTPFQLMIGTHGAGPFEGRLYYDVAHDEVDSLYVRSTEMWTVLEPYLNEQGGAEPAWTLPDRHDELVGTIAFNGDSGWSNREPFAFAGHETQVLYLAGPAGPGAEHHAWLQAALDSGHDLARRAGAMAAEARGWDPAAVTVAILLVGAGSDGLFVGSLTCHGGSGGPCYVFTHDRFRTLSLERE